MKHTRVLVKKNAIWTIYLATNKTMHPTRTEKQIFIICVQNKNCDWIFSHYFVHSFFCYTALSARDNFGTIFFFFAKSLLWKLLQYIFDTH